MAGTAVVPLSSGDAELPLAAAVRTLQAAGWKVVLVPPGEVDHAVNEARGEAEADGRPVVTHFLAAGWC